MSNNLCPTYPINNGRSDDLHFFDDDTGFVINSGGYLSFTEDGGISWKVIHENKGTFFRCITFVNRQNGGKTWKELIHAANYYYVQGIGFADPNIGFMGGSSGKT